VKNDGGRPKIEVEHKGETKTFFAEEVSTFVLFKGLAHAVLGNFH